jgi:hypothetical protein
MRYEIWEELIEFQHQIRGKQGGCNENILPCPSIDFSVHDTLAVSGRCRFDRPGPGAARHYLEP